MPAVSPTNTVKSDSVSQLFFGPGPEVLVDNLSTSRQRLLLLGRVHCGRTSPHLSEKPSCSLFEQMDTLEGLCDLAAKRDVPEAGGNLNCMIMRGKLSWMLQIHDDVLSYITMYTSSTSSAVY